uniref:WRKY19-like zinc finger domain-containing protein n=1 Tax=Timema shepardi TaxID=629360 RepID=A0A7R9AR09_TIMSH|nr:unnamed protein product [Timema shepardi]
MASLVLADSSQLNVDCQKSAGTESSDGKLIFREDVAAYLQQIKSTNLGDVNELPTIQKPLRTKCVNSTATLLHQIHSSSSTNLKRENKPRKLQNTLSSEQVNLTISKTLVPILIDLCKVISTHTPNEITESNETDDDNCSKVVNSERKDTPTTSREITPIDKLPESNKENTMVSECSIIMNDALDSPGRVTTQAQRCQPKRKRTFKSFQQSIPKSHSLALQSSKNTFEFGHILDISSENVHASDDGVALSHLSSNVHIDAIDEINSNDDENSYQDDFEELDGNTDDSLEEQKNQSFQWRYASGVGKSINQEGIQTKIDCNGVTKTRRRCKQAGCPKNSQRRGYCIQHGGSVPKCNEDGCHRNLANALVVLSSTAEDGEIEVLISVS